jgi:PAS domain S-box-containing protein
MTFINAAAQTLLGYSEQELLGQIIRSKIYSEQTLGNTHFLQERENFFAGRCDRFRQDILIKRKNGETRWVDYAASMVRDTEGKSFQLILVLLDITERFQMVRAIEEANEQTQIMLDATPMGCTLWDENGNLIDCNMEAVRLFELSSKQEFRERFFELLPEYQPDGSRSVDEIQKNFAAVLESGWKRFEWMHQKIDGTSIPCEISLVRVKRGERDTVVGYSRDLREIKKYEAAREQDLQRTNALLELAQMTQQSEQEVIDYAIKSVVSLTDSMMGYSVLLEHAGDKLPFRSLILDESFHCSLPTMTDAGTPHVLSAILTGCLTAGKAVIHDDFASLPGTRTFPEGHCPVRSHMSVPIMDGENPVGLLGVGNKNTPYTEADAKQLTLLAQGLGSLLNRKKYAESLEKAKFEAENANKAKSEFLAHMSHEIRTPLNGVIGLSELLAGTPLNEKQEEYVQLISASGNALLFLINDILDFSKIEAGKLDIDFEPFDLSATIQSVLASLVSRTSGKNLELAVSLCNNLPQIVLGDSGRIRQILLNLMGNAVKFTEKGGVRVDVTIESVADTSLTTKFNVVDTGIGIPDSAIERLFQAFSQVDSSTARTYGGTGLGLAISMQLVRLMHGDIGVESVEGKGSAFWFTVPFECEPLVIQCYSERGCPNRRCPNREGSICTAFINREIDAEYSTAGRSVLIVDDNEVQREALRIQLRNWGMTCVVCSTAEEALRWAKERWKLEDPFDLFIIDSTLADKAGVELARELFEHESKIGETKVAQVVLLRSLSEEFDQEVLDEIRTESIGKPVFPSTLFNAVMNRIYAAEIQKGIDSGIITPTAGNDEIMVRPKPARKPKPAHHSGNPANRLKSHLAGKIHVLIVEDNRVNQIVAKNLLEEAGFTSDIADDGVEACSAIRNKEYDIVLMDCQMPEMDGYEATKLIRDWERELGKKRLPIIALTANATKEDVKKCLDAGMDAYCSKPINPLAMIRLIEEWYEKAAGHFDGK